MENYINERSIILSTLNCETGSDFKNVEFLIPRTKNLQFNFSKKENKIF